jgi:hypothetical protein
MTPHRHLRLRKIGCTDNCECDDDNDDEHILEETIKYTRKRVEFTKEILINY